MPPTGTHNVPLADDPVRMALDDSALRDGLLKHALAQLSTRFRHRPASDWNETAGVVFQDTCLRALEKRDAYDPQLPVRPWLHGIMNLVLCETVRAIQRLPAQQVEDAAAWEALAVDLTPDVANRFPIVSRRHTILHF
jgi:DNA-directed RNA polymerase specialized sigma24 family protein